MTGNKQMISIYKLEDIIRTYLVTWYIVIHNVSDLVDSNTWSAFILVT